MPEYLTKEEIRQWRSSLERITLDEYAARLGKIIQGEKQTNDIIDKVMTNTLNTMETTYKTPVEKIQTISFKPASTTTVRKDLAARTSVIKEDTKEQKVQQIKEVKKLQETKTTKDTVKKSTETVKTKTTKKPSKSVEVDKKVEVKINVTFKKPLIPREQMIFDFMLKNRGMIVYAKDMASLLELPRDYVYKYIKNLRQKINEEVLFNADNGGYVLKV